MELRNGLRELTAFAERQRLAIGDFAHLRRALSHTARQYEWGPDIEYVGHFKSAHYIACPCQPDSYRMFLFSDSGDKDQ